MKQELSSGIVQEPATAAESMQAAWLRWAAIAGLLLILGFWFTFRLTDWPRTWFDEGSHLHVPKTLVQHGVYADISSEGYRHYGPTIGVGPTVMLPIAGVFEIFGIGLLQARLVIVLYMIAACVAFFALARMLGNERIALVATLLLVVTPVVDLVEYGRQVLGEVPGLFFVCAGLWLWFRRWERARWYELAGAGILLGLAIVTKYQVLIVLAGGLGLAWLLNFVTFKAPQRLFLIPGSVIVAVFAIWQTVLFVYLGPSTIGTNIASFREAAAGAAAVFNPELMLRSMRELMRPGAFLFLLLPVIAYSGWRLFFGRTGTRFSRTPAQRQQLIIIWLIIAVNLVWYVVASVSWIRYAFLGVSLSAILVALILAEWTNDFSFALPGGGRSRWAFLTGWGLLLAGVLLPGLLLTRTIVTAPVDASKAMAAYLNEHVPQDALIETWEPQMGFLTDHLYHYPQQMLLNSAVRQVWMGETPVNELYDFTALNPDYVLTGVFAQWVNLYPAEVLDERYVLESTFGSYQLYERIDRLE